MAGIFTNARILLRDIERVERQVYNEIYLWGDDSTLLVLDLTGNKEMVADTLDALIDRLTEARQSLRATEMERSYDDPADYIAQLEGEEYDPETGESHPVTDIPTNLL